MTESNDIWTVKRIMDWCEGYLANKGDANPRLSAQWLLGEALGLSRIELYTNLDKPLSEEERATMRDWVARRGSGEPLQLICGTAPFRHMVLEVAPGVLIPRPETEVLVSEVLALYPPPKQVSAYAFEDEVADEESQVNEQANETEEEPRSIRAVDLCTGSGCIACALATEHPNMEVIALDIAPEALELARCNAEAQGVADRVTILESDLLAALMVDVANEGAFDVIISNPPYIPSGVVDTLDAEVNDFEPRLALDGGADGLDLFRRFIGDAFTLLKPGGLLAVELFESSLETARTFALEHGFANARVVHDLANNPRILIAFKPSF